MIDLGELDTVKACNDGAEIELRHPVTKAPLGVFWTVLGKDSDAFREHVRDTINDDLRRARNKKRTGDEAQTVEMAEQRALELLLVCSRGWRTGDQPVINLNGEQLTFSVSNAKRVLTAMPWVKDQIDAAIADLENFLKA